MKFVFYFLVVAFLMSSCGYNRLRYVTAGTEEKVVNKENKKQISSIDDDNRFEIISEDMGVVEEEYADNIISSISLEPSTKYFNQIPRISLRHDKKVSIDKYYKMPLEVKSGYYEIEAESKFKTAIILFALGIVTIGFTYLIGLGVFIAACVHYSKINSKSKSTKTKFWWALSLLIFDTLIIVFIVLAMFYITPISIGSVNLGF